jgi:superfamily II RNA helicase
LYHSLVDEFFPIKRPDWTLTPALAAWMDGGAFDDVLLLTEVTPGDLVRSLRMAIQLMRQTRRAIDPVWDLGERLETAMALVDRDEVDARRQLELG